MINILLLKGFFFFSPIYTYWSSQTFNFFSPSYTYIHCTFNGIFLLFLMSLYHEAFRFILMTIPQSPLHCFFSYTGKDSMSSYLRHLLKSRVSGPHLSSYLCYRSGLKHLTSEDDLLQFWNGWQKSAYVEHVHFAPLLYISSSHCVTSPLGENCFSYKGTDNHKVFPWNVYANQ